ncbi:MAG: CPBP family intramembrane metalloprotease [Candidatus Micrarchaeota archaeon]|nr:CPBP family intramembrane metalloprotease [Candidatus Micrarchaeota archaeon]
MLASFAVLFAAAFSMVTGAPQYIAVLIPFTPAMMLRTAGKRTLVASTSILLAASLYIPAFSPILLSLIMLLLPAYFALGKPGCDDLLLTLGFNGSIVRAIAVAVLSLIPAFIFMVLFSIIAPHMGLNDGQLVEAKISTLPLYILAYAVTLGPLSEEIFFRAFLPKYTGGIISSVLFGLAHYSYGSYFEVAGAFLLGLYLYALYRVSGDIKAPIIAHMLINAASLYVMFGPLPPMPRM